MADQNFTEFTAGSVDGNAYLVGYDVTANEERKYPSSTLTTFINGNLPEASSTVAGISKVGAGLTITSATLSANVTSVASKTGAVSLAVTDISGAAASGANSDITSLANLTSRPSWKVSSTSAMPWDSLNLPVIGGRLIGYSVITTTSTASVPANTSFIIGEAVGAGGGSGGSAGTGAGQVSVSQSGSGGTYCKFRIDVPSSTISIAIGSPGAAGAASASGNGGTGGTTTVGTYATIPGGVGGAAGVVTTFSSPYLVISPSQSTLASGNSTILENQSGSSPPITPVVNTTTVFSNPGGDSRWGAGASSSSNGQPGTSATQYGAGGSGCALNPNASSAIGGSGGSSKVILYFYANQ